MPFLSGCQPTNSTEGIYICIRNPSVNKSIFKVHLTTEMKKLIWQGARHIITIVFIIVTHRLRSANYLSTFVCLARISNVERLVPSMNDRYRTNWAHHLRDRVSQLSLTLLHCRCDIRHRGENVAVSALVRIAHFCARILWFSSWLLHVVHEQCRLPASIISWKTERTNSQGARC